MARQITMESDDTGKKSHRDVNSLLEFFLDLAER